MAVKNGFLDVALVLAQQPNSNPNHVDKDGNSALNIAAKLGYKDISLCLLERGAYLNTQNKVTCQLVVLFLIFNIRGFMFAFQKGDSILITAVKSGHKEIVNALLARNAEIDAIGNVLIYTF